MSKKQPEAIIKIGSVVQLKSGGPKMVITGVNTHTAVLTVVWANESDNIVRADIPVLAVNIIKY